MNRIYIFIILCIAAFSISSCVVDEKGLADGSGSTAPNAVYMGNVNPSGVVSVIASDEDGASFAVTPRLVSFADEPVTIKVKVDVETLNAYNKENGLKVRPIAPEDVHLVNSDGETNVGEISAVIKPGEILTTIDCKLDSFDATKYPYDGRFAVPIKISEVKGSLKLLSAPVSTIVNLNRKIKTSVFHLISPKGNGYTIRFTPKTPYQEEMSEWTLQYIAQFNNIHGGNQTTASLSGGHGFYNRISTTGGLQVKSEGRDGPDTWTGKQVNQREWLHVSYVYRKSGLVGKLSVYVNGELHKIFTTSLLYFDNASRWGFGNSNVSDFYLREVRYWNRALSAAEIQDKYYLPEDPNANGLEAYFPMTKESYDEETGKFRDLTDKWEFEINKGSRYEIIENVVFPAKSLKIETP